MGDSFISIVPWPLKQSEVEDISKKAIEWLIKKEIITNWQTACVLGNKGYPPGARHKEIFEDFNYELSSLTTNGLEIITKRHVFHNGGIGLAEILCVKCGFNNIYSDWEDIVNTWFKRENDILNCIHCKEDKSITEYNFIPKWGFGEFGLTFWNWPKLKTEFIEELKNLLGKDIQLIYGNND